jgi:hypothetical protein
MALALCITASCNKQDAWLDAKQKKSDVVPSTLKDFQAILDDYYFMNDNFPGIGLVGADNYYMTEPNYNALPQVERNAYLWKKDIYEGQSAYDWTTGYRTVEYANIVLDGLKKIAITSSNRSEYQNIKGEALFFRAFAFYTLAQIYCRPYDSATSNTDLGIPLRLTSDISAKSVRATVSDTYNRMINDLKEAVQLMPTNAAFQMRPGGIAAKALLGKVFLSMGDYQDAGKYADSVLTRYGTLLDYNSDLVSATSTFRFPVYPNNPEIIFYAYQNGYTSVICYGAGGLGYVDSTLYNSYDNNDLRKSLFYIQTPDGIRFAGTYSGTFYNFCGIATDEIYLIRAECEAREGKVSAAMSDLNTLLRNRYKTGTFVPLSADNTNSALTYILNERRKELPFTGQLRWEDIRRLNKDPRFSITLKRAMNGKTYTLPPDDDRYTYPIPDDEIQLSGIQQNTR